MRNLLNASTKFFKNLALRLGKTNSWQRALVSTRSMMGYLNRVPILLLGRSGRTWVLGSFAFARFALRLKSKSGFKGLAITLKVSHTLLVKKLAGSPIKGVASSLGHRVGITRSGLPRWFPKGVRVQILKGDLRVARVWLTLCNFYRVLEYLGKPKIKTITEPGRTFNTVPYLEFVSIFHHKLIARGWVPNTDLKWEPRLITKAGPGSVGPLIKRQPPIKAYNSTGAIAFQAIAFNKPEHKELLAVFKRLAHMWGQDSLVTKMNEVFEWSGPIKRLASWAPTYLGKLGVKEEPGKVRVFAMVDWWTQMLLRPFHKFVFGILRNIPQDATFDQDRGVLSGVEMIKKTAYAASYDLSAATDRLPVLVQSHLVNSFYPGTGQLWAELLVGRLYALPRKIRQIGMKIPEAVRYEVGQPMGALSSWAMLALTHHFIVQYAAFRVGHKGWFSLYLVLGDDIVIFDRTVAASYLDVMKDLGVGINLVKSVVSTDSFEFAKRFYTKGVNLSPVSFKELDLAGSSIEGLILLYSRFAKDPGRISPIVRLRGYGYRTLGSLTKRLDDCPRHLRFLIVFLTMPGISSVSWDRFVDWFGMTSLGRTKLPNPHSLYDVVLGLYRKMRPESDLSTLTPRAIWACTLRGLGRNDPADKEVKGVVRIRDWRMEYLESVLDSLFWPQQVSYVESHRESDKLMHELDKGVPVVGDIDDLERFINDMFEWDAKNSLTPVHINIHEYRNTEPHRARVGRWLRWWSLSRTSAKG
jgi:hypothetical protein